jgi:hypothetical protein
MAYNTDLIQVHKYSLYWKQLFEENSRNNDQSTIVQLVWLWLNIDY